MTGRQWIVGGAGLLGAVLVAAVTLWPQAESAANDIRVPELSGLAQRGEALFNENCAACHGPNAGGTQAGPPLVHVIYEPSHHGDGAFYRAVAMGVRAHHWPFGNMPPVAGVPEREVTAIVAYVRELQRANGIR